MEPTQNTTVAELSDEQLLDAYKRAAVDRTEAIEQILRRGLEVPERDDAVEAAVEWEGDELRSDPHVGSLPGHLTPDPGHRPIRGLGTVWPAGDAHPVAGTVTEDPRPRSFGVHHYPPAGGDRGGYACLRLLSGQGDVDVHGVAELLGGVEVLHPHRGAVAQRVYGVVLGLR